MRYSPDFNFRIINLFREALQSLCQQATNNKPPRLKRGGCLLFYGCKSEPVIPVISPVIVMAIVVVPVPVITKAAVIPFFFDTDTAETVNLDGYVVTAQAENRRADEFFTSSHETTFFHFIHFNSVLASVDSRKADVHVIGEITFAIDHDLEIVIAAQGYGRSAVGSHYGGSKQDAGDKCKDLFHFH
jgi:hypothetical protein